jgi:glyoxylase-like metal-dependent hydrolase (beta-lactamase superfamily II)
MVDVGKPIPVMVTIRNEIEALTNKKVDTVILTHFHSDHTGATPVFSDCTIISSTLLLKRLKEAKRKPHKGYTLVFPNKTFDNQLEIQDGGIRLIVKQTGGHSSDSTYVYCPEYRVLAAGDNLIVNTYPFGGKGCNPDLWIHALREYVMCDVDSFIPGHGPVTGKDGVTELLDYMVTVRTVMRELITAGNPAEDVLKAAGDVKYCYTPQDPTNEQYYKRWKERYLRSWYNAWKKEL